MRHRKDVVYTSIGLYTDGLSLNKVRRRIKKTYGVVIKSNQTILNWLEKFGKRLTKPLHGLAERLHCDETKIRMWKKGLFLWLWAMRCKGSQPIGWHISMERDMYNTDMLMWETRRRFPIGYFPKIIRTDKMPAYSSSIAKVFDHEVKHEKVISFKHGNNVIENFWRCKNRFPRFRTMRNAKKFIDHWMWETYENEIFLSWVYWIQPRLDTTVPLKKDRIKTFKLTH